MDFKKVLDQTVKELKREVNKSILKVPEIEQKNGSHPLQGRCSRENLQAAVLHSAEGEPPQDLVLQSLKGLAMVIMGVSGSGKSTIGHLLADSLGCTFLDADDFHSAENKEKMKQGIPLTDSDRSPWLETLRDALIDYILRGQRVIMACSALKPSYRCILRTADFEWMLEMQGRDHAFNESSMQGVEENCRLKDNIKIPLSMSEELLSRPPEEIGGQLKLNTIAHPPLHRVQFLLLNGPITLFALRLEKRYKGGAHFMPPSLLQSQMDSLKISEDEDDIILLDASMTPEAIVNHIKELVCHNM